jgi:hypothetical protein
MGRRVQNRGKRNLFLNFFEFRKSGLLKTPLPPMSEFVLIFQTPLPPLGSDILCEWPLREKVPQENTAFDRVEELRSLLRIRG